MALSLKIYKKGHEIPDLPGTDVFHSKKLFLVYEATPGYSPYMIVATDEKDKIVSYMLAVIRKTKLLIPPFYIKRCEIYGRGVYLNSIFVKEYLFAQMLQFLTNNIHRKAFLIEFRNLGNALWGYKYFRENNYFPVNWLRVKSSLHSQKTAEERFSPSRMRQIKKGLKNGAKVEEASPEDIHKFAKILHSIYSTNVRKQLPNIAFFDQLQKQLVTNQEAKLFIVKYKEKIIGGSACIYTNGYAYLWFSGGMRKSYAMQNPGILAVWAAYKDAFDNGYSHLEFVDVGLPFKKHGYRDFVLRFGGKQSSTRRWFHFRWQWLNKLLIKIYV